MKALILCAALAAASFPALAQTNVSITVGQPGFYGRLDIGDYGPPPVYMAQPVIIERHYRAREPVYLRVPPGHRKNWRKHCRKYGACGQPVLFVQDRWYNDVYAPRYREVHYQERYQERAPVRAYYDDGDHGGGHGKGHGKGHDKGHGKGHGNGKGHGRGHD